MTTSVESPAAAFRFPEATRSGASLAYREGLPVLTVAGSPEEIGRGVGELALRPGERMTRYPDDSLRHFWMTWLRGPLLWMGRQLLRHAPAEYLAELDAMSAASGVDRDRLVLGNTLFDIKKLVACSAFLVEASRSKTGSPLLARNLDYPSLGYAHEYTLVTAFRPAGRKPFVSVGFPGLIGVLSGMNADGLALSVLEVFQSRPFSGRLNLGGTPYAMCFRRILETCSTVDGARDLLQLTRRSTLFNLVVADRRRVAVLECTPRRVHERPAVSGVSLCTNHFCLEHLQPIWARDVYTTYTRHRALREAERAGRTFGVADLHAALLAAGQDDTLQTMVFEPGALRLHLAFGTLPASAGPLRTLEIGPLLANV
jgi:isopenicillin-N N-acyltransferase like protein